MESERHDTHILSNSSSEAYYDEKGNLKIDYSLNEANDEGVLDAPLNKIAIKDLFNSLKERNNINDSEQMDGDSKDKNNINNNNDNIVNLNNKSKNNDSEFSSKKKREKISYFVKKKNINRVCKFSFSLDGKDNTNKKSQDNDNNKQNSDSIKDKKEINDLINSNENSDFLNVDKENNVNKNKNKILNKENENENNLIDNLIDQSKDNEMKSIIVDSNPKNKNKQNDKKAINVEKKKTKFF